ncbi:MAG: potassium-transporting ATPase subunit KdpB [Parachlamydiales bacterium]|jgi:K+-transporting ATPase ATPase B chain
MKRSGILTSDIVISSIKDAFLKLSPWHQIKNPVMFVTFLGAILTTLFSLLHTYSSFNLQLTLWLWFTVFFANFASAIAEGRGKAQAASLKKTQTETPAIKIVDGKEISVPAAQLKKGDIIACAVGDTIPADGEVIEGIATVDESAITGESAPVIRESGGDRSAVTAGTRIVSDKILIEVTSEKGHSFLDKMIHLIEGAQRQKTPNEIALNIVLSALTLIFVLNVVSIKNFADYSAQASGQDISGIVTIQVLIALLVCLIPTTISALLSAIGIAGMDRLIQSNVIAKSGKAVEAAGDIDLLILDKTGTITLGNRMATEFYPAKGVSEKQLAEAALLASLSDETPEGRSIVVLAKNKFDLRGESFDAHNSRFVPFTAQTRMSGIDLTDKDQHTTVRSIRKGAVDAVKNYIEHMGSSIDQELETHISKIANSGGTPLLVCDGDKVLGVVQLKDIIKGGIKERFAEMRKMGIRTVMITGDNPLTAGAIAAEAGVDDFIAQATPEMKLAHIQEEQKSGHLIAMTGDGTNDAPALAQADVGLAMNTGTQASREAGNMVDLDSNPTKLIDIVEIGKQLLMTRGALTTFSISNDVAKYFAIIPALFGTLYAASGQEGPLQHLNLMRLYSPESAILSAVIFNALIIIALIPLALKGVPYRPQTAAELLRHNLLVYGLGGLVAPFIGIKIIDLCISGIGLV